MSFNPGLRRRLARAELDEFEREFSAWRDDIENYDPAGHHRTQLAAITDSITRAAGRLTVRLDRLDRCPALPTGEVYNQCRLSDLRALWLRRVWAFYREKFEQRGRSELRPLLAAADEVIWSCYAPVFRDRPRFRRRPPPLPYVEAFFSPVAVPADLIPGLLQDHAVGKGLLTALLSALPVGIVRVPPAYAREPWWLVYLAHEVGHHVQFDLLPKKGLVASFEWTLYDVAARHGADSEAWKRWACEVFADAFSLLTMGPWALWALAEVEYNTAKRMTATRSTYPALDYYPPAAVRLRLMAEIARHESVGLDPTPALRGLDLEALCSDPRLSRDCDVLPRMADTVLAPLPGVGLTLPELCSFRKEEFDPGRGVVTRYAEAIQQEALPRPDTSVREARLVACATVEAWSKVAAAGVADWREKAAGLAAYALDTLPRCAEPVTRAGDTREAEERSARFAELLSGATPDQLGT